MRNLNPLKRRRSHPLADELVDEILIRLPAKSVGRFRCVCKRWLSHTTQTGFILAHAARARTSGFFLRTSHDCISQVAEYIPLHGDGGSRIPDPFLSSLDHDGLPPEFFFSCNGLVLLRQPHWSVCFSVLNPLTGAHHLVPPPPRSMWDYLRFNKLFLAFDPSISPHFDIVSIKMKPDSNGELYAYMYIYSSETRKWRLHTRNLRRKYGNWGFHRYLFWNGCLVWNHSELGVLCLGIRTELTKWLPLPITPEKHWCRYFGESCGRLHYITQPVPATQESITRFDVLELKPDASGWSVLHKVDLDCIESVYPEVNPNPGGSSDCQSQELEIRVVCFLRGDGRARDRLLLSIPGKVVCFLLHDRSFTTICSGLPRAVYSWEFLYPHAHSLLPLDSLLVLTNDD